MVQGLAELNRNLKLVKTFTDASLITAMELSQNKVATNAKSRHIVGSQLSREQRKTHPDSRFYTWSADLVNSIKAEKVQVFVNGLKGEITASEPYATLIEIGGPNSRAFPFFGPALEEEAVGIVAILGAAISKVIK